MYVLQLELRILAHLTDCKSMLKAFSDGGDFHSRTAMNMYSHVRRAVENGDVILEWEPKPGEQKPPVPLLKVSLGNSSLDTFPLPLQILLHVDDFSGRGVFLATDVSPNQSTIDFKMG